MTQLLCEQCGARLDPGQRVCLSCGAICNADKAVVEPQGDPALAVGLGRNSLDSAAPQEGFFSRLRHRIGGNRGTSSGLPQVAVRESFDGCGGQAGDASMPAADLTYGGFPSARAAADAFPLAGQDMFDVDDYATAYCPGDGADDDATVVLSEEEAYVLVRETTGERIPLVLPAILGKGSQATCLISGNGSISRQHARICRLDGQLYIEDLGSTNHTKVDGEKLAPGDSFTLELDQEFVLSDEGFRVEKESDSL